MRKKKRLKRKVKVLIPATIILLIVLFSLILEIKHLFDFYDKF